MSGPAKSTPGGSGKFDRYPGPRSFTDSELDQRLFFGREHEIDHLLHRVRAVRLLVLFGKSGMGKTSLLQAGLYPRLRVRGLLPIPVRLDQPKMAPVRAVFEALQSTCREHGVDYEPRDTEGLWEFFKTTDLWRDDVLQTPVLIFDQFEELFTLQPESVRVTLANQLGELVSRGLPTRIRQKWKAEERHTDTPPDVKIVLSLREEYVAALEDLSTNVPTIFEHRFRLAPLPRRLALRAVVEPAAMDDPDVFNTRPFRYSDGALDAIMEFLVNRQGEVEPFQLQIVCRHAEKQVVRRMQAGDLDCRVDEVLLGGRNAMEKLLETFYSSAVRELPSRRQRLRARNLCELGLLSPSGHRVSMEQSQIHKQYKVSKQSLNTLTQARLVRKENRPGLEGFYYELSHDSVASAVNRGRRFRVSPNLSIGFVLIVFAITLIAVWQQQQAKTAEQWSSVVIQQVKLERERADTMRRTAESVSQSYVIALLKRGGLIEPEMVTIPSGTFRMGDVHDIGPDYERPVQPVTIQRRFAVSRHEITFEEYDQFASATGRGLPDDRGWGRGRRPVVNVSWQDAVEYSKWLSVRTGKRFRLLSEAEWEYAARSGGKNEIWAGTSREHELGDFAWYLKTSGGTTHPVGTKNANGIGLHDMSGNVFEWVQDCWHENYKGAPRDGSAWLELDGGDCGLRLLRGGSWGNISVNLRSSYRDGYGADFRYRTIGFRLAQDIP